MRTGRRAFLAVLVGVVGVGALAPAALGEMRSTPINSKLCETKGGGKFVKIPGFPGEKIDRRLLTDIEWLLEKYKDKFFITDGYSTSDVHARNGEHPIGLALDIIPNFERTKKWRKVSRLAKWAEPKQDQPRAPFRWVGYNGDAGHGRKDHLHLSWSHSDTRPEKPARTVYTIKCPGTDIGADDETEPEEEDPAPSGGVPSAVREIQRHAVAESGGATR
jgi:hypothetical protein